MEWRKKSCAQYNGLLLRAPAGAPRECRRPNPVCPANFSHKTPLSCAKYFPLPQLFAQKCLLVRQTSIITKTFRTKHPFRAPKSFHYPNFSHKSAFWCTKPQQRHKFGPRNTNFWHQTTTAPQVWPRKHQFLAPNHNCATSLAPETPIFGTKPQLHG